MGRGLLAYAPYNLFPPPPVLPALCFRRQLMAIIQLNLIKILSQTPWKKVLPLLLGVLATIAVILVWERLTLNEQYHYKQLIQQEAQGIELQLSRELTYRIVTLKQMANRWEVDGGTAKESWEKDAEAYIHDFSGYQAIEWVDPTFRVRWVVSKVGNEVTQNTDFSQESRRQITLKIARNLDEIILTRRIRWTQGGQGFLATVPLFIGDGFRPAEGYRFDGFIVGVFHFQTLFDSILNVPPGYKVAIYDGTESIYRQGGFPSHSTLQKTVIVRAYGADWRVVVASTKQATSPLPIVVLIAGLTLIGLCLLVVYLIRISQDQVHQLKRTNQQLQQEFEHRQQAEIAQTQLAAIVEFSEDAIISKDLNSIIRSWNHGAEQVFGYTADEILGQSIKKLIPPEYYAEEQEILHRILRGESIKHYDTKRLRKDGTFIDVSITISALKDKAGTIIGASKIARNITESKQAQESLYESELRYRQLINNLNTGFVIHAPDTKILLCNSTACDLLGLTIEQMMGKTAIDPAWHFVREDGTQMPIEEYPINRVLSTQTSLKNYVLGINSGKPTLVWVLVNGFPEFDHQNQLKQIGITFIDITKIKQAEAEQQEMSEVMENALSGISKLDAQGRYLYVNKTYAQITGYQPEEMIGMLWQKTVHPDDLEKLIAAYELMLKTGRVEVEATGIRKDGSIIYKQLVMIANSDEQHQLLGHYCFMKDISEKARLEAERKQAELKLEKELLRTKALFNTSLDGIVVMNNQGDAIQSSPRFAEMIGYTPEETLSLNVADWDAQWTKEQLQTILKNPNFIPLFETRHRRKDGSEYDVEISYSRVTLEGEVIHFCICRDISKRKQAEIDLQISQARFAGILEIANDAIISVNQHQEITLFNKGAEQIFGYQAEEILGKPLALLIPERFAKIHHQHLADYAKIGGYARPMSERGGIFGRRKDGSEFPAEASISNLNLKGEIIFTVFLRDITARQEAEAALRQSEEKFRTAIDFTYDWEYWLDTKGQFIYTSPSCERITGFSPNEFITNPNLISEIIYPDDFPTLDNHICNYHSGVEFAEFRIITRSSEIRWISHTCQPLFSHENQFLGLRISNRDITEQKQIETQRQQAEQALRESEARFQAFMNHSPAPAWITDINGLILYVSQTYSQSFQLPTEDLLGKTIFDIYPTNIAQQFLDNILTVSQTHEVMKTIEIAPRPDGSLGDFLVYKFPIPDPSGQILIGGVAIDVTQQHQAETALHLSEERLQLALEASGDGLWDWNIEQGEVYLSSRYQEMLGYQPGELQIDLNLWIEMIHPDDRSLVWDCLNAHLKDSFVSFAFDYRFQCKSGEWKWIADYGKVVAYNAQGQPIRMIGTHKDISDRKQKEIALRQAMEAAEQANLAKSIFLANMSHELRTPLNVILGFTQVMAHDPSLTPNQQEDLQTIRRSGDHLLNLINDVLDLSKIESGHCTLEESDFDLIALLHSLRNMLAERASSKGLDLYFDIAPDVAQFIRADAQKLRQILINLLGNAIKFTHQGSITLQVRGELSPEETSSPCWILEFAVIDTGVGIAPEELDTIFNAFVQAQAGKQAVSGTGLGLTISRKLLQLMGGDIAVRSTIGKGTTFSFTLPVSLSDGVDLEPNTSERLIIGLAPNQPHHRILVVDDRRENRLLIVRLLTELGFEVREACNGQEAVQQWQEWQPDLTWMDIRMPILDGYEATRQIRAMEQGQSSIIIALTAQASRSDRTLALAAGCNDYMSKPFREQTLFQKMAQYLGIEYRYAESVTLEVSPSHSKSLTPEEVKVMPPEWIMQVHEAALDLNDHQILELIAEIPPKHQPLIEALTSLVDNFQLEAIAILTKIEGEDR